MMITRMQGMDMGSQYRSGIYYHSEQQKAAAEKASTLQVALVAVTWPCVRCACTCVWLLCLQHALHVCSSRMLCSGAVMFNGA